MGTCSLAHWSLGFLWTLVIGHWTLRSCFPKRYHHAHQQPARFAVAKLKLVRLAVELLQPGPCVGNSHAFGRSREIRDSIAVVPHLQEQLLRLSPGTKLDLARPRVRLDAMLNGIPDQRLQDQIWHPSLQGVRRNVH